MVLLIGTHTGSAVLEEAVFWVRRSGSTKDETLVTLPLR